MTHIDQKPRLIDAAWNAIKSIVIGGLSMHFHQHENPWIRIACLTGGLIGALLALVAAIQVLGWLAGLVFSASNVLLRHYGFRKALAAVAACAVAGGGVAAIKTSEVSNGKPWLLMLPVALGLVLYLIPDAIERTRALPPVLRLFMSGGKPREDFAGAYQIKKLSTPLRHKYHAQGGYLSSARYIGRSLPESTLWPRDVFSHDSLSEAIFACSGGGKFVSDIAINGCIGSGSAIYASTKADIADALIGRRSDPDVWFGPNRPNGLPGIDVRGITKVTKHIPNARSALLDPQGLSIWSQLGRSSGHPVLSDVDIRDPNAASLIFALVTASVPVNERHLTRSGRT